MLEGAHAPILGCSKLCSSHHRGRLHTYGRVNGIHYHAVVIGRLHTQRRVNGIHYHAVVTGRGSRAFPIIDFIEEGERFATCFLFLEEAELLAALGLERVSIILALLCEVHEHVFIRRHFVRNMYRILTHVQANNVVQNVPLRPRFCL